MSRPALRREGLFLALVREGVLEIDADGGVWRRKLWRGGSWRPSPRHRCEWRDPRGYLMLRHKRDGKIVTALAHRVVYEWFNGSIPDGLHINHINGIKSDNRPANLEAVTPAENNRHAVRTGLSVPSTGDRRYGTRVPDATVREIRERYAAGERQSALVSRYGLAQRYVSAILLGQKRLAAGGPIAQPKPHGDDLSYRARDPLTGRLLPDDPALRAEGRIRATLLSRSGSLFRLDWVAP